MRFKALAVCCAAAAAVAALTGCASQESYTPPESTPVVTSPAIGTDGVLRVGVNGQAAPLAGANSSGSLVGFDVDLAAALADELGLKVEVTDVGTDGASALADGTVDVVLGVEQDSMESEVWESDPYLQTAVALFSQDANASVPTDESGAQIAVQSSSTSSWMAENEYGSDALVRVNSLSEAFEALASGEADYAASDAVRGMYVVSSGSTGANASIIALMQQPSGYCAAVLDSNAQLKQAVTDAIANLVNGGMVGVLDRKWLGSDWDLSSIPLTAGATSQPDEEESSDEAVEGEGEAASDNAGENAVTPEQAAAA